MFASLAASSTAAAGGAAAGAAGGGAAAGAGGAGAGGAAGAGAGPLVSMINQVQFMAICGRVGGEEADEGTSSFSAGLDWVNFSPPFEIVGGGDGSGGRREGPSSCDVATCGLCVGKKLLEKLIVCAAVLALMFSLRWMCCTLYMRKYPEEPKPPDMSYPNWYRPLKRCLCDYFVQRMHGGNLSLRILVNLCTMRREGPVLLMQLFGLCDASLDVILSGCWYWIIFGVLMLACTSQKSLFYFTLFQWTPSQILSELTVQIFIFLAGTAAMFLCLGHVRMQKIISGGQL